MGLWGLLKDDGEENGSYWDVAQRALSFRA